MLATSMPAFLSGDRERVKEVSEIDDKVDFLYSDGCSTIRQEYHLI
jgi:phosphate uptake regulator